MLETLQLRRRKRRRRRKRNAKKKNVSVGRSGAPALRLDRLRTNTERQPFIVHESFTNHNNNALLPTRKRPSRIRARCPGACLRRRTPRRVSPLAHFRQQRARGGGVGRRAEGVLDEHGERVPGSHSGHRRARAVRRTSFAMSSARLRIAADARSGSSLSDGRASRKRPIVRTAASTAARCVRSRETRVSSSVSFFSVLASALARHRRASRSATSAAS